MTVLRQICHMSHESLSSAARCFRLLGLVHFEEGYAHNRYTAIPHDIQIILVSCTTVVVYLETLLEAQARSFATNLLCRSEGEKVRLAISPKVLEMTNTMS